MENDSEKDLERILNRNDSSAKTPDINNEVTNNSKRIEEVLANIGEYLSDKERLKALGVFAGSIAGIVILKEELPKITEYIREVFPILSKEVVSLTVDTVTNTLLAPIGFLLSNYAHNKELNKKEFLGQVAFAAVWGVIRHYVYSGLSNFDEITPTNASLKTGLYTVYYAAYGGLYAAFSEYWRRVCDGIPHIDAIKGVGKNFKKKLMALAKDSEIQLNLALNIANMFNPWVESRPTAAGGLLVQYNMSIVKQSHEREHGLLSYIKEIFTKNKYDKKKPSSS